MLNRKYSNGSKQTLKKIPPTVMATTKKRKSSQNCLGFGKENILLHSFLEDREIHDVLTHFSTLLNLSTLPLSSSLQLLLNLLQKWYLYFFSFTFFFIWYFLCIYFFFLKNFFFVFFLRKFFFFVWLLIIFFFACVTPLV